MHLRLLPSRQSKGELERLTATCSGVQAAAAAASAPSLSGAQTLILLWVWQRKCSVSTRPAGRPARPDSRLVGEQTRYGTQPHSEWCRSGEEIFTGFKEILMITGSFSEKLLAASLSYQSESIQPLLCDAPGRQDNIHKYGQKVKAGNLKKDTKGA